MNAETGNTSTIDPVVDAEKAMQAKRAEAKTKTAKAKKPVAKKAAKAPAKKAAKKGKKAADGTKATGPDALKACAPQYHHDKEKKTAGGNVSVDSDDEVAKKLRGKSLDDVYAIVGKACAPDMDEKALRSKYKHLNVGMQRMNLGNKLRGILNAE